ncbi:hypothetical protein JT358_10140 [Micrococcales bacterium 31B]|nr:hypothetical protein [Micrococcales bacterium 31B]
MTSRNWSRAAAATFIAALGVSGLAACTDDAPAPAATTSASGSAAPTAAPLPAERLVSVSYRGEQAAIAPLAGTLEGNAKGCVSLKLSDGTLALAIFPKGWFMSTDKKKVETVDGAQSVALNTALKTSTGWTFTQDQVQLTERDATNSKYTECLEPNTKVVSFDAVEPAAAAPAAPAASTPAAPAASTPAAPAATTPAQ